VALYAFATKRSCCNKGNRSGSDRMRVRGDRQPGQQAMVELQCSGAYRTVPATQPLPVRPKVSHSVWLDQCPTCLYHTRGLRGRSFPQVLFAVAFAMAISYRGLELPQSPVSDGTSPKCKRNAEIRARHQQGESIATLAEVFGISEQRIWQILNDRRK
jgi:hypothetical protein